MPTGQMAADMAVPPTSVTISDQPPVPTPETQDTDDQGAEG